jgi:hypothetical protein
MRVLVVVDGATSVGKGKTSAFEGTCIAELPKAPISVKNTKTLMKFATNFILCVDGLVRRTTANKLRLFCFYM